MVGVEHRFLTSGEWRQIVVSSVLVVHAKIFKTVQQTRVFRLIAKGIAIEATALVKLQLIS